MTQNSIKSQSPPDEREGKPSASGAERLVACLASWPNEQAHGFEGDVMAATAQGTEIAAMMEAEEIDEDAEADSQVIAEKLGELEQKALAEWTTHYSVDQSTIVGPIREARLWLKDGGEKHSSAKLDVFFFGLAAGSRKVGLFLDHKTGFKDVTASPKNWQLRVQAIALAQTYGLEEIWGGIAHVRFGAKLDYSLYSLETILQLRELWIRAVARTENAERFYAPGKWCGYCSFAHKCPAMHGYMSILKENAETGWKLDDRSMIRGIYNSKSGIEKSLALMLQWLKKLPKEEMNALGFDLEENAPNKPFKSALAPWAMIEPTGLMTEGEYWDLAKMSKGALIKELAARYAKQYNTTKKAGVAYFESLLEPVCLSFPKAPSLKDIEGK